MGTVSRRRKLRSLGIIPSGPKGLGLPRKLPTRSSGVINPDWSETKVIPITTLVLVLAAFRVKALEWTREGSWSVTARLAVPRVP